MDSEYQDIALRETSMHPSWLNYVGQFFFALIFFIVAIVMYFKNIKWFPLIAVFLGIAILIKVLLTRFSFTYTITKDCVRSRNGLIARNESEIRITDIKEVGVSQSIWQRLLGLGGVYFASAGTGGVEVTFEGVYDPYEIKDCVNEIRKSPPAFDKKRCQQCGEFIWINAKICPYCKNQF